MVWPPPQASKDAKTPKAKEITIIQSRIEYSPTMPKYNEFSKAIMKTPPTIDCTVVNAQKLMTANTIFTSDVYAEGNPEMQSYNVRDQLDTDI